MVTAIFCITLCKLAPPLRRALATAYITNSPGVRTAAAGTLSLASRGRQSHHPHLRRPSNTNRLTVLLSELSTGLQYITLATWRRKEAVSAVRSRQVQTLQWRPAVGRRSSERERGTPSFVLSLRRTSRFRDYRCSSWSSTRVILLEPEEMGVRATCRSITNSTHLVTNHTNTIPLCGVTGPRSIQAPHLDVLWALSFLPSYVSLYITWNPSLSVAYRTCTPTQCSTHILPRPAVSSNHDFG